MTTIRIEGWLGELLGRKWDLKVKNFVELFNAIENNTHKLRSFLLKNRGNSFAMFVDGELVDNKNFLFTNIRGKRVDIMPVLAGATTAIASQIASAVLGTAEGFAFAATVFVLDTLITAVITMGISILIAKLMAPDDPQAVNTTSFVFGSAENVSSQGQVVPVGYGRVRIGSKVISTSMSTMDKTKFADEDKEISTATVYGMGNIESFHGARMSTLR
ncbi:MAG TPA: tail assembly protein [Flavobacteriales bacterium]|nr:tail assembly protein [Flavobacteriales bacterium]